MKYMAFLPLYVIAAQVVVTAIRMINIQAIKNFYENDKRDYFNALFTGFVCCLRDPITGVGLGLFYYYIEFTEALGKAWSEILNKEDTNKINKLNTSLRHFPSQNFEIESFRKAEATSLDKEFKNIASDIQGDQRVASSGNRYEIKITPIKDEHMENENMTPINNQHTISYQEHPLKNNLKEEFSTLNSYKDNKVFSSNFLSLKGTDEPEFPISPPVLNQSIEILDLKKHSSYLEPDIDVIYFDDITQSFETDKDILDQQNKCKVNDSNQNKEAKYLDSNKTKPENFLKFIPLKNEYNAGLSMNNNEHNFFEWLKSNLVTLHDHLFDIPREKGNYIIYRVVGVVNFMNIKEHINKIKAFAKKDKVTIVLSLRYLTLIDFDALTALKYLYDKISKTIRKQSFKLHNQNQTQTQNRSMKDKSRIIISGVTKTKLMLINNQEWINNLIKDEAIIFS